MIMPTPATSAPVIGIFTSDRGPGDAERASLMSQAGTLFARKGARLVCLAEDGVVPVPLVTAARTAGGTVELIADESIVLPPALAEVPIRVVPERAARHGQLAAEIDVLVALPGSLASVSALFGSWAAARGAGKPKPVVLLNRHRAYEAVRGFANDVLAPAIAGHDRHIQVTDSVEDLWNKVSWLLQHR